MHFFGHQGEIANPGQFFREQEYIICRGALDDQAIGNVVDLYQAHIVPSKRRYLRQSTHWELNQTTPYGGVINGLLNPHSYEQDTNGRFSDGILKLLSAPAVQETLALISGKSVDFTLYQTMFFDHNTTRPHQDWCFLDSRPNGHLIAGWFALEDILPEGIRFYVYPGTHHFKPRATYNLDGADASVFYQNFMDEIQSYVASERPQMYAPPLRKGDIFFWGSRVIHGSTLGTDPQLRRRSIAAHFVPEGFSFGDLGRDIVVPYRERYGLRYAYSNMDASFKEENGWRGGRWAEDLSRRLSSVLAGSGTAREPKAN